MSFKTANWKTASIGESFFMINKYKNTKDILQINIVFINKEKS